MSTSEQRTLLKTKFSPSPQQTDVSELTPILLHKLVHARLDLRALNPTPFPRHLRNDGCAQAGTAALVAEPLGSLLSAKAPVCSYELQGAVMVRIGFTGFCKGCGVPCGLA